MKSLKSKQSEPTKKSTSLNELVEKTEVLMQNNSMDTPSYYAILPSDVRYDSNLSSSEKLLYAELTALCSKHGYCWASNSYFSELYKVNKNTVSSWVSSLVKRDYIEIDVDRSKGNLRKVYLKNI